MRYIFKILILGDPGITLRYIPSAFEEDGTDKETYFEWFVERKVLEDICDLEIVVITDLMSADFDDIIPSVDGIIYFLNPLYADEFEFFEMVIPIIESAKRESERIGIMKRLIYSIEFNWAEFQLDKPELENLFKDLKDLIMSI